MGKNSSGALRSHRVSPGRGAVVALIASGVAWGTSVPLSKVALAWLAPGWLTVARFGLSAAVLLIIAARAGTLRGPGLAGGTAGETRGAGGRRSVVEKRSVVERRSALALSVLASGALGYGLSVTVQNVGVGRTSVTHASLIIGATPILVAVIAAVWQRAVARPVAWAGYALSMGGVGLIAGGQGHGATPAGDLLVLAATTVSALATVVQGRLLAGRDPIALTAVQFLGAAVGTLPFAAREGLPDFSHAPAGAVIATLAVAVTGTLVPFSLFAFAQKRVRAEIAGAFLNLEPLVGAIIGIAAFGDPAGARQLAGGLTIIAGLMLSVFPGGMHINFPRPPWRPVAEARTPGFGT